MLNLLGLSKPIQYLIAAGIALTAVTGAWYGVSSHYYNQGYQARVAEEAAVMKEKTDAANTADAAARKCALDPACSVQSDGFRRD